MKKKIIIAGAILVVLAGGFGVKHAYSSYMTAHTSSSNEYYYNEDTGNGKDDAISTEASNTSDDELPSRDEVNTTPDSIYCLVNKDYSLPSDYEPDDLVVPDITFSINYESEKKYMRQVASDAIETLFADAKMEELELVAVSGYRSYERQQEIYENNLKTRGTTHTNQYSAKPGYSEHQTGLVMDVSCKSENYDLQESFGDTPEGKWVAENCAKYGFVIRYPEGKSEITGYAYEPWHLRYVGVEMAAFLTENNLTLDEYYHYEPSFDFITDESEYVNDTEISNYSGNNYSTVSSPTPSTPPSNSNSSNNYGNTNNNTSSSSAPVASSSAPAPETTVSSVPESAAPEEGEDIPEDSTESVSPSTSPSTPSTTPSTPSTSPSAAPSTPTPSPSPSSTTTTPPQPDTDDDVDADDGASEALDETL